MGENKKLTTLLLLAAFLIGLSLLLYPTVADCWNSIHQSQAVAAYADELASLEKEDYSRLWEEARAYNAELLKRVNCYNLTEALAVKYPNLLKVGDSGVMGYVEIPTINVVLPIYHGTDDYILQTAVGHLDWTSLPVGGKSTHAVISGHRGLPSAKLFTDLDDLIEGDIFMLQILDETLTYEVDLIKIVEPGQATDLVIFEDRDLCTLVTCTPYGVNTHRLLVRGHRIENREEAKLVRVTSEAMQIEPLIVAPVLAIPILSVLLLFVAFEDSGKSRKAKR